MNKPEKTPRKSTLPEWAKANPQGREVAPAPEWSLVVNRNTALIAAAGAALVLSVVFGVGYQVAKKVTTADLTAKHKAEMAEIVRSMAPTQAVQVQAVSADPRTPGLNYLRLCQVPLAEGEKLAAFLAAKGQRTWRVPVDTAPHLVTLYATKYGFTSAQRVEFEQFRAELRGLGDKWAKQNKGGNPFRSMMLDLYKR